MRSLLVVLLSLLCSASLLQAQDELVAQEDLAGIDAVKEILLGNTDHEGAMVVSTSYETTAPLLALINDHRVSEGLAELEAAGPDLVIVSGAYVPGIAAALGTKIEDRWVAFTDKVALAIISMARSTLMSIPNFAKSKLSLIWNKAIIGGLTAQIIKAVRSGAISLSYGVFLVPIAIAVDAAQIVGRLCMMVVGMSALGTLVALELATAKLVRLIQIVGLKVIWIGKEIIGKLKPCGDKCRKEHPFVPVESY